jgi:hypothetical protein
MKLSISKLTHQQVKDSAIYESLQARVSGMEEAQIRQEEEHSRVLTLLTLEAIAPERGNQNMQPRNPRCQAVHLGDKKLIAITIVAADRIDRGGPFPGE